MHDPHLMHRVLSTRATSVTVMAPEGHSRSHFLHIIHLSVSIVICERVSLDSVFEIGDGEMAAP